ncbi:hypothetical protein HYX16_02150 [Candidatus Woesearchaeota archaeon]|nr:hypothetical protein [Candidatus Woesearchaeota archaeon]
MQRLNKAIKRVAALGVGVAMLGATITGAVAQAASLDLANLPEPFVSKAGVYSEDTALVVGSRADVSDTLAVGDVSAKLQYLAKTAVSTSGTVTVSGGVTEDVPAGLGIANSTSVALDFQLDKTDINSFFDGAISFQNEDIETHDELVLQKASPSVQTSLTSSEDDYESNVFLETTKGAIKYYYVFDDAVNVTKSTSSDPLEVKFLGKTLKVTSVDSSQTKFTATVGTEYFMKVGDVVTVSGKKVTLQNVGSSGSIQVDVDGKIATVDADASKTVNSIEIKNDDTFYATSKAERSAALIIGEDAEDTFADGDEYVGQDKNDPDWTWKLGNLGAKSSTTVSSGSSDPTGPFIGIQNEFVKDDDTDNPPGIGECYKLPNNYAEVCMDSARTIHLSAPGDERFVIPANIPNLISNSTVNANDVKTSDLWLETEGADAGGSGILVFYRDVNSNPNIVYLGNLSLFNMTLAGNGLSYTGGKPVAGLVASSALFARMNYLKTKDSNIRFSLTPLRANTSKGLVVSARGDSSTELDPLSDDLVLNFSVSSGNFSALGLTAAKEEAGELAWSIAGGGGNNGTSSLPWTQLGAKDEDHRTKYGIIIRDPKSNGASDKVVLEIPGDQVQANVVVKGASTTVSGGGVTYIPAKITVNTRLDTEVSDPSQHNLILIGGPCADPLVERVAGLPKCGEWALGPGEALLQLAKNGDNVALLVAGTDAMDTRMAGKVFSNYEDYDLSGSSTKLAGSMNAPRVVK